MTDLMTKSARTARTARTSRTSRTSRAARTARRRAADRAGRRESALMARFAIFAECLLTGVWIGVAALPLVTLPAAVAAGAAHLRRRLDEEYTTWREFAADVRDAARGGWLVGLAGWLGLALVWADLAAARTGLLPGARFVGVVSVAALLVGTVALLRAAVRWRPGAAWRDLLAAAVGRTLRDPAGSLVLVCGFAVVAASCWFAAPLVAPALGILTAAALAVERRRPHR